MNRTVPALAVALAAALAVPARAQDAKSLFATKCASCHGPDGKGKTKMGEKLGVPDLTATTRSEAEVEKTVSDGKPPKMMSYRGKLTPEQIKSLATYVKGGLK